MESYPDRILARQYRGSDWALNIDGMWFYWAGGRLIPEGSGQSGGEMPDPHPFFAYQGNAAWRPAPSDQEVQAVEARMTIRESRPIARNPGFFDQLWHYSRKDFVRTQLVTMEFLGKKVTIHSYLQQKFESIEAEILQVATEDARVTTWLEGMGRISAFADRAINGTLSRSMHSYGIAIDLEPRSYGNSVGYWRWAYKADSPWYKDAWARRWTIPEPVVQIFHRYGFIWGGNWLYFDPIHFEYRPELLLATAKGLFQ